MLYEVITLDESKICHVTADDGFLLDNTEEVVIAWIGFNHDGRPVGLAVVDKDIHPVG